MENPILRTIDWPFLARQKTLLVNLQADRSRIDAEESEAFLGLIHLLDEAQRLGLSK